MRSKDPSCGYIGCPTSGLLFGVWVLSLALLCDGRRILLVFVDGPIEHIIVLEGLAHEEITEDLAEVRVVGLIVEAEITGIVQICAEFVGKVSAESLGWRRHLLLHDTVVFLLLGCGLESLPWKRATTEVEHHIAKGFHIITTRLLDTEMGIDTSISSCSGQVLVLAVWDVEVSLRVTVFLC